MTLCLNPLGHATAYDWKMDLGLYGQYLDNPELRSNGGSSYDAGQVALNLEGQRASEIRKSIFTMNNTQSRNNDSEAPESNRNFFDLTHQEFGERSALNLHGNYEDTTTLAQALISGNRASANVKQNNWSLDQSWQYNLTQKWVASIGAVQMRTTYDQVEDFQSSNFKDRQFNGSAFYTLSEIQSWGINLYEDKLTREADDFVSTTDGVGVNYRYNFSETLLVKSRLGYRTTQSKLKTPNVSVDERKNGRSVNIDVKKGFERWQLGLSFVEDLTPKFNGSLDQTKTSEIALGYRFSEKLGASSKINLIQRKPLNQYYLDEKIRYTSAIAAIGWTPYEPLTVEATYRHVNQVLPERNLDVASDTISFGFRWQIHP